MLLEIFPSSESQAGDEDANAKLGAVRAYLLAIGKPCAGNTGICRDTLAPEIDVGAARARAS